MQEELEKLNRKIPRAVQHILFWVVYVTFFSLLWGSFKENYFFEFKVQLLFLPVKVAATYITLYYLMPRYLLKGEYTPFFLVLVGLLLFSGFLLWATALYIERPLLYPGENWNVSLFYPAKILKYMTSVYPVVAIAVLIKFFKYWYKNQKATQQLAKEKLEAELKFLKAQIHPHFLFNTLNNLYALTLKKADTAPEMVLKLSELLNYMLYECNVGRVPLSKEILLVRNYLALEKIRYGDRLDVVLNESVDVEQYEIAPLLVLPFVENSFKHGVSGETGDSWVSIDLEVKNKNLTLKVENSKSNGNGEDTGLQNYKEGIGLKNVKRRLELLYNGGHELKILDTKESYLIILKLSLYEVAVNA